LFKIAALLAEHKVPYAAIFGNHDDEGSLSRNAQMSLYESLPYSLSEAGPNSIDGVGNYFVEVLAHGNNKHSALTLYFLDTHSYSPDEAHYHGYDWIKPNQIKWFKDTAETLKDKHQHYTKIHMNMAFIHIPLPEYRDEGQERVGDWKERVTAPTFNTNFKDALVEENVLAVSCGHDHANDYCAMSKNPQSGQGDLWMCYAGGSGFGGYGGYGGYHRRARVFDIDANEARISTWKRVEYGDIGKRVDEQIIVDAGKVVPPPRG
jgi:DNA repair exonuclease SbcCD nuclease subunit